jgi:hypothetical protein
VDKLIENLVQIIGAAAQSQLGILALLSVALSMLAYLFFAAASEKVKVGMFILLFLGVVGFGTALFRAVPNASSAQTPTIEPEQLQLATASPLPAPTEPLATVTAPQTSLVESTVCETRNWNHGTQQTMHVSQPTGSTTRQIVISVKNLDDNEFQGACPSSVPYPPEDGNYAQRKCTPRKFHDMTVEWVRDQDEGDKRTVTVEIKNGNQAPARTVKLCVTKGH